MVPGRERERTRRAGPAILGMCALVQFPLAAMGGGDAAPIVGIVAGHRSSAAFALAWWTAAASGPMLRRMSALPAAETTLPLPSGWPKTVKTGLLHVVGLARIALIDVRAGFASGPSDAKAAARTAALESELAQLREELRIKDARMLRLDPRKRPHFTGEERLAILVLRAARGWTTAETARRFLLTAATVGPRQPLSRLCGRGGPGDPCVVPNARPEAHRAVARVRTESG